jgi:hypothetical protein
MDKVIWSFFVAKIILPLIECLFPWTTNNRSKRMYSFQRSNFYFYFRMDHVKLMLKKITTKSTIPSNIPVL